MPLQNVIVDFGYKHAYLRKGIGTSTTLRTNVEGGWPEYIYPPPAVLVTTTHDAMLEQTQHAAEAAKPWGDGSSTETTSGRHSPE